MEKLSKFRAIALAAVLSVAVAVPLVIAQSTGENANKKERHGARWQGRGMHRGDRGAGRLFGQLDLTDAQKAQIKQIRESHNQNVRSLRNEIRTKRQEIRQATESGSFNEALVSQKLAEIAPLEAKLMGERFRVHQETLAVLTPEQKTKLEQLREESRSRRTERRPRKGQGSL
jgi:protein CpxP